MPTLVFHQPCDRQAQDLNDQLAGYLSSLEVHSGTRWYWSVSAHPLDVAPGVEADALVSRVFLHLQESFGISGHQGAGSTYEKLALKAMMVWSVTSDWLTTKLSVVHFKDELFAFVSGTSDGPDKALQPWLDAIQFALATSGDRPTHIWQAVLGMEYANGIGDVILRPDTRIGDMTLRRAEVAFEETISLRLTLHGSRVVRWQPVLVAGATKGHSWNAAQFEAQEQLHLLCALLSVHTNHVWSLRQIVLPESRGPLVLPQSTQNLKQVPIETTNTSALCVDECMLEEMWTACQAAPGSATIARAYYEALGLVDHPSFALVGFVGVIEEIGSKLFPDAPQEKCEGCGRQKGNIAAARFRKALSLVVPEDRVKVVSDRLYKWRSGTAHAGRTYSTETSFGHPQMSESMLVPNAASLFQVRGPSHAREIARDLVVRLLVPPTLSTAEKHNAPG